MFLLNFLNQVVADHKFHTECFSCGNCQQFLGEEDDYVLLEQHRLTWYYVSRDLVYVVVK